jgi:hypothetical protein
VGLGMIGMGPPIFALVPVVHFLFPGAMVVVLVVAGTPVDWSSSSPSATPLPGGVRNGLSLFGRLDRLGWSLLGLHSGTTTAIAKSSPLVGN